MLLKTSGKKLLAIVYKGIEIFHFIACLDSMIFPCFLFVNVNIVLIIMYNIIHNLIFFNKNQPFLVLKEIWSMPYLIFNHGTNQRPLDKRLTFHYKFKLDCNEVHHVFINRLVSTSHNQCNYLVLVSIMVDGYWRKLAKCHNLNMGVWLTPRRDNKMSLWKKLNASKRKWVITKATGSWEREWFEKKINAKKALKHIMGIKGKHSRDFQDELTF